MRRLVRGHSGDVAPLDQSDEDHDDGGHKQDVDEATKREAGDESQRPKDDEDDCNGH